MRGITLLFVVPLFFGCGGSDKIDSTFKVTSNSSTYSVVEGMKKDIALRSNRDDVIFEFVNKSESPDTNLNPNTGIIEYRSPQNIGEPDHSITVRAIDKNGKGSEPLTITFKTVSNDVVPNRYIIRSGANDNGIGLVRNFTKNDDGHIIDPLGNIWENKLEGKQLERKIYMSAKTRCDILRLKNKDSNWRVPTVDEVFNLIDYSKVSGSSMLDDSFEDINLTSWVAPSNGRYLVFSQSNGLTLDVSQFDKYPVRCINAPIKDSDHIVSTDRYNKQNTVDFSTGLMWSEISSDTYMIDNDENQSAVEYCASYDDSSGWRLPSISELRSIIENGYISNYIMRGSRSTISATPYNDIITENKLSHYSIRIDEKGDISQSISYADSLFRVTCVKEYN